MTDSAQLLRVDAIADSNVFLRELTRADVDEMARWPRFRERELAWANLDLTTPRERDAYYELGRSNATRKRFAILTRDERVVGTLGLRNIDRLAQEGTLGIIVRADEVGRGYGTDAIRNALFYAFQSLGLRRVLLDVAENNLRARRCYDGIGFAEIGRHLGPGGVMYIDMVIWKQAFLLQERIR